MKSIDAADIEFPPPDLTKVIGMRLIITRDDGTHETVDLVADPAGELTIRWNAQGIFEIVR